MFRIGEFSKLTQVSIRMLRYYDEIGLLKPAEVDKFTGYRYYSVEQISVLQKIIFLRNTGYAVSEIMIALDNWSVKSITEQLKRKQKEIQKIIQEENKKLKQIETTLFDIKKGEKSMEYDFMIKAIPSYKVLSLRRVIPNYYYEGVLWKDMSKFIYSENIEYSKNSKTFSIYHDQDFREENVDVELCVIVDKLEKDKGGFIFRNTGKVDKMACAMVYGAFENISSVFKSFAYWLSKHDDYSMINQTRQIVHRGPWNEENKEKYLTEIQIPVERL